MVHKIPNETYYYKTLYGQFNYLVISPNLIQSSAKSRNLRVVLNLELALGYIVVELSVVDTDIV